MTAFVLMLVGMAISIFWGGYVASVLWGWFIVPLGVTAISYAHAVGIAAVLSTFLGSRGMQASNSEGETAEGIMIMSIIYAVFIPAANLAVGWLVK
jgi:hypothetical protein